MSSRPPQRHTRSPRPTRRLTGALCGTAALAALLAAGLPFLHGSEPPPSSAPGTVGTTHTSGDATPPDDQAIPAALTAPDEIGEIDLDLPIETFASGTDAVAALGGPSGAEMAAVAAAYQTSPDDLAARFDADETLAVDPRGRLLHVEQFPDFETEPQPSSSPELAAASAAEVREKYLAARAVTERDYSLTDAEVFSLESRPGARRTLYLNFEGADLVAERSAWYADGWYRGWDPSKDGWQFNVEELAMVKEVWQRVSADFAPFDINVTTQRPGYGVLERSDSGDPIYGAMVLISDNSNLIRDLRYGGRGERHEDDDDSPAGGTVGLAYIGKFPALKNSMHNPVDTPAVVWGNAMEPATLAWTVSHEAGHLLNLQHTFERADDDPSDVSNLHSRIMDYQGARALRVFPVEDRRTIEMGGAGAPLLPDETGTSTTTSALLPGTGRVSGMISNASGGGRDEDWYRIDGCSWLDARVAVSDPFSALDLKLSLRDSSGAEIAASAPATAISGGLLTGTDAQIVGAAPDDGVLHLVVSGSSQQAGGAEPAAPGAKAGIYPSSHVNGRYTLDVAGCAGLPGTAATSVNGFSGFTTATGTTTLTWDTLASSTLPLDDATLEIKVGERRAASVPATDTTWSTTTTPGESVQAKIRIRTPLGASAWVETRTATGPRAPLHVGAVRVRDKVVLTLVPHPDDSSSQARLFMPQTNSTNFFQTTPVPRTYTFPAAYSGPVGSTSRLTLIDPRFPSSANVTVTYTVREQAGAPTAPTGVTAHREGRTVTVVWAEVADDGGAPVDYEVKLDDETYFRAASSRSTHTFSGVDNDSHRIQVRARNRVSTGPATTVTLPAVGSTEEQEPPSAPTSVVLDDDTDRAVLTWSAPRDQGSSPITGWVVTIGNRTVEFTRSTRSMALTGFRTDRAVTVSLAAFNADGVGPARTVRLAAGS